MTHSAEEPPEPPRLRALRRLVTTLTLTLIIGFVFIVGSLVYNLNRAPAALELPEAVELPAGEAARAATLGRGWVAVVTEDAAGLERIRVFDARSGAERAMTEIAPAP